MPVTLRCREPCATLRQDVERAAAANALLAAVWGLAMLLDMPAASLRRAFRELENGLVR